MEVIKTITEWAKGILGLLSVFFGLAVFSELIFGGFLGDFSIISNFIAIVGQFGSAGFVGLLALLAMLTFLPKKQ